MYLDKATLRQLEQAICEICQRSGWGAVQIIIERGQIKRIVVQLSLGLEVE